MNQFFMSFVLGQALVSRIDGATAADKTTGGALLAMFGIKQPVGVVLVSSLMKQRISARPVAPAAGLGGAANPPGGGVVNPPAGGGANPPAGGSGNPPPAAGGGSAVTTVIVTPSAEGGPSAGGKGRGTG